MKHKKRVRMLIGEKQYNKVYQDIQQKVIKIAGLTYGALPIINDALWDANPTIEYDEDFTTGNFTLYSIGGFFDTLKKYIELFSKENKK